MLFNLSDTQLLGNFSLLGCSIWNLIIASSSVLYVFHGAEMVAYYIIIIIYSVNEDWFISRVKYIK